MIRIVYVYLYIGWRLNIEYQIYKQERVGECYSMPHDDFSHYIMLRTSYSSMMMMASTW